MKKFWTRIFTPTIIVIIFLAGSYFFTASNTSESAGWGFLAIIMLLPCLIPLLVLDIILKVIKQIKTYVIWIVELVLIFLVIAYWFL